MSLFSVDVIKLSGKRQLKKGRFHFGSLFQGGVHRSREGMAAGA